MLKGNFLPFVNNFDFTAKSIYLDIVKATGK